MRSRRADACGNAGLVRNQPRNAVVALAGACGRFRTGCCRSVQSRDAASAAFATFGRRSEHPAKLNFGDCMAYAVSAVMQAPLLFKGADFGQTDVIVHPASIRA
jgi:hypothetical protein